VNRRLAVTPLILVAGGLVAAAAWPRVAPSITAASLSLEALTQPRTEVVVTGYLRNHGAPAFHLETLEIEEPGKKPYRRQISLDADRKFELVLGQPVAGSYRVAAQTRQLTLLAGARDGWLKTPELVVQQALAPGKVGAIDYDDRQLGLLCGGLTAAAAVVFCWGLWSPPRAARRQDET
jgi:hypothetical protein